MSKELRNRLLIILAVIMGSVYCAFPLEKRINLGLDLKGGMHLILQVETEKLDENAKSDAVVRAIEILRNRIDSLGVSEPVIQRQGEEQIIVQLPGITDRDKALQIIGKVAQLTFHLVSDSPEKVKEAIAGQAVEGYVLKYTKEKNEPLLITAEPVLKGEAIADARVDFDTQGFGLPKISLTFNDKGGKEFGDITTNHVNERLAIVLDNEVLSAPNINEPILSHTAEITGQFTVEEASLLALALRSGSLPAPMHTAEERTIGPLLGKDSIKAGIEASLLGGALVLGFMLIYYLTAGLVADIALILNFLLIVGSLGFLKLMLPDSQVTLTLPGIAGIILTLGMAVDANVLINERIREELANGRPLRAAINAGFTRAFSAIFDSNVTTLIAAFMLFQFGSGPIKGFAVTLSIGLIASMFTALYVTKTAFLLLVELNLIKSLPMLQFFKQTKIDFIAKRYFCYALSLLIIGYGLFNFFKKGNGAFGIDFVGGQIQEYRFAKPIHVEEFREALKIAGVEDAVIQESTSKAEQSDQISESVIIRTSADTSEKVTEVLKTKYADNNHELLRIEKVGPIVGKALRQRAIMAIIFALAGILVYVGFRFKHFDFAAAGVIALLHDVIVTLVGLVLLGRQIDLLVVTALLTIAGYSINDTIVIYDRVRENMGRGQKMGLAQLINLSVNQMLGRTFLTSFITFLVVMALYLKGGEVLNTFALALIIGFISGVYSTIYIASPLVLLWQKKSKA